MSATPSPETFRDLGDHYGQRAQGDDPTWLEDAIEDILGITVTDAQRKICRAIVNNEKVLVQTANSVGKSFIAACIINVWLACHYPASVLATSGTYPKLKRTLCKPVESLHNNALGGVGLPGTYKRSPPRIEIDGEPNQYFEAASPQDAGELEGVHEAYTLAVIEEADKDDVDSETLDSMDSLVTDQRDRIVAIANPPMDESNSINALYEDDTWEVIKLSSFDSHNVQIELGEIEGEKIDALATIWKIKQDWESFNDEPWPGVEEARTAHERRDDLDARWYRRRAGVMPPEGAGAHRPFEVSDVNDAYERDPRRTRNTPSAVGIDVARKHDKTVMIGRHGDNLIVHYDEQGANHQQQGPDLADHIDDWPGPEIAVDFVGGGQGLHDYLDARFPNVHEFNNGSTAADDVKYENCWTEALAIFGEFIRDGGTFTNKRLREEALIAARTVTFQKKHLASRGASGTEVLTATPKDDIKEELGRSPDYLDAALMAVWADEATNKTIDKLTW